MIQILIHKRLRALLQERGMKQRELARMLNVSDALISQWANGIHVPCVEDVVMIAQIFGTTTDYLIGLTDERGM